MNEEMMSKLIDNIESKMARAISGASFLCAINDVINEFLVYTNRDEVPENALGLIENMVIKRYCARNEFIQESADDKIKSYTQGNISITYKDDIQKDYELSESEKIMMNKFVISKATRIVKRRK